MKEVIWTAVEAEANDMQVELYPTAQMMISNFWKIKLKAALLAAIAKLIGQPI